MSERAHTRVIARTLFIVTVILLAIGVSLMVRTLDEPANIFAFRGDIAILTSSFAVVGLVLASRRPENPIGWIFLGASVASGLQTLAGEFGTYSRAAGDLRAASIGAWVDAWIWVPITGAVSIHVFLLFPTGRLLSPRWRWFRWVGTIGIVVFGAAFALGGEELGDVPNPFFDIDPGVVDALTLGSTLYLVGVLGGVTSLIVRFRRSRGDERQQLKWFAAAATLLGLFLLVVFMNEFILGSGDQLGRAGSIGMALSFAAVPVSIGISILKYRLYDLDVVVSRTVLYGALVGIITLVYLAIVVGVGSLIGTEGNLLLSIVATAVIAVAFQPLRDLLRRFANRLVYGRRATPYEVMSEFADRVAGTYSLDEVLPRMATIAAEGTGAERVEVWVRVGRDLRLEAWWPTDGQPSTRRLPTAANELPSIPDMDAAIPVTHQDEVLGAIAVAMPRTEALTPAGEKLLGDLASQAGLVLRNVRLIEELRASRQRLVAAQDEERRRLERNIHDGAQQQLVAFSVKLRLARTLAGRDLAKAEALLEELQADNQDALENLRDLARGIYPPLLADQGLAAALEAQARKAALPVDVLTDGIARYPQEAEAAVYFCVLEALQNIAKYAEASRATVRIWRDDGRLAFSVQDDGRGFDPDQTARGSGLQNMADRLDALGGALEIESEPGAGTTVRGGIPAQARAESQASESRSGSNSDLGM
jgi:signal transduction histidine kinase